MPKLNDFPYKNEPPRKKILCFRGRRPPISQHPDRYIILDQPDFELLSNKISTSKYTFADFLPKNLLEQFSKPSNFYFLIIGLLQLLPSISNSDNIPTIYLPLFVIIMISMVKDCFEDYKRHKSDQEENKRKVLCLDKNEEFKEVFWEDLRVGHIVKILQGQYLPADLLLVQSSGEKGECFIETKNLDGETNLKHKNIEKNLREKVVNLQFKSPKIICEYERPNPYLYQFSGKVTVKGDSEEVFSMNISNFVLRGSSLQNTKWIIDMVAYTGHDSKIMLNSTKSKPKYSKVDRLMNRQIKFIFLLQNLVCLFSSLYGIIWYENKKNELPYLLYQPNDLEQTNTSLAWARNYVTLEMVKFIQGLIISKDHRLKTKVSSTQEIFTEVHSSNLNEELGQINYIFSDKTGTLTKNIMEFKYLTIGSISYGSQRTLCLETRGLKPIEKVDFLDERLFDDLDNEQSNHHKALKEALLLLAVTHNIIIEEKDGEITYNASSPDELSLANFARFCGFIFQGIGPNNELIVKGVKFKVLHYLEFSSSRKRSSIILENESGQIILYCKGADSVIFERMLPHKNLDLVKNHLENYATTGLRTLVLAKRYITQNFYQSWSQKFYEASISLVDREEKMSNVMEEIEKEFELVGATAIEDKLQDNVGETISSLKEAGIQIWVLTGDKIETAINIGFSCRLLNDFLEKILLDGATKEDMELSLKNALLKISDQNVISMSSHEKDEKGDFALIISGEALIIIMEDPEYSAILLEIASHCKAILACRVSPKQKGELVSLVRQEKPSMVTLAIGDGANDVNMISAAHVGIGIKGVEGHQAARASDYAIGEFKLLKRLCLYVGRESYRKNSCLICYNFYKNMILVLPLFWFAFYNGFSGVILYDSWLYQLYNLFYCSLPIIIYALFDEEFPNTKILEPFHGPENELENTPKLYEIGLFGTLFNTTEFWKWIFLGVAHSIILTLFSFVITAQNFVEQGGKNFYLNVIGEILYTETVIMSNLKILIFSYVYFPFSLFIIFGSVLFYFMNYYVINIIDVSLDSYNTFSAVFGKGIFYILLILIISITLLLDLALLRIREINKKNPEQEEESTLSFEEDEIEKDDLNETDGKINEEKEKNY